MQIVEKQSQILSNNDYEYTNKLKDFIDKDHQLSIFSIILGTVIVVVGSFVLLGWFLNIEILKRTAMEAEAKYANKKAIMEKER